MKRIAVLLVLAFAVALGAYAEGQADQAPQPAKPVTLTFYYYATQTHILYMKPLKEAFLRANPTVTLNSVEVTSGGYEGLSQKILLGLAAGDPPDVGQVGFDQFRTMIDSGSVVALDDFMAKDPQFKKDNLFPAMMSLGQSGGRQYLVPIGTSTPAMLVNTDLFASVGLDVNNLPKSWDDVRKASETLKAAGKMGVLWGWSVTGNWIFQAMLDNAGGSLVDKSGTRCTFNSPAGVRTLKYMADLAADGLMPVTDQTLATFLTGNLGMLVDSSFQRVNTPSQAKFNIRFVAMPTPDGKPPSVPAGGNGVMMFAKDPARQQAAWKMIRFFTEEQASNIVAEFSGYTPANQAVIRQLTEKFGNDPNYKVILDQAARVTPWYSWPGKNSNKIAKTLRDAQEAALLGKKTAQQALDEAAAAIDELLK
jgi:multiple sugar transport system substrate-binding protein